MSDSFLVFGYGYAVSYLGDPFLLWLWLCDQSLWTIWLWYHCWVIYIFSYIWL